MKREVIVSLSTIPSGVEVVTIPSAKRDIFSSVSSDNFTVLNLDPKFHPYSVDKARNGHFRLVAVKEVDINTFSSQDFDSLGAKGKRKIFHIEDTDTFFRSVFYLSINFTDSLESNKELFTLFEKSVFIADMLESQSLLTKTKGFSLDITSRMVRKADENTATTKYMKAKATSIDNIYTYVNSENVDLHKAIVFFCSLISYPYHVNSSIELQRWENSDKDKALVGTHIDNFFQENGHYFVQSIQEKLSYLLFPELLPRSLKQDNLSNLDVLRATTGEKEDIEKLRTLVLRLNTEIPLNPDMLWKKLPLIVKHYESNRGLQGDELLASILYMLWLNTFIDKNMTDSRLQKLAPDVDSFFVKHLWTMNLAPTFIDSLNPYSIEDKQHSYYDFLSLRKSSFSVNRGNSSEEIKEKEHEDYAFLDSIISYENSENLDSTANIAHKFYIEDNLLCCIVEHLAKTYGLEVGRSLLKEIDDIFYQPHMTNFYVCTILLLNGLLSSRPQLLDNSEDFCTTVRFVCFFVKEFADENFYDDFVSRKRKQGHDFVYQGTKRGKVHALLSQGFQTLDSCAHTVSSMNAVCTGSIPLLLAIDIAS